MPGRELVGVTVGAVLFGVTDPRLAARGRRTGGGGRRRRAAAAGPASPAPRRRPARLVTSTTKIAGAGVLGNERRPDESCARDAAAADPGPTTRPAHNAAGVTPDVARCPPIRSASWCSPATSSTPCARSACSRASSPPRCRTARSSQPSYLGTVGARRARRRHPQQPRPGRHRRRQPRPHPRFAGADAAAVSGSWPRSPRRCSPARPARPGRTTCAAWVPRPARGAPPDAWSTASSSGPGRHRRQHDASHFQASVVQLTDNTVRVYGTDNFPASVLAAVGVDRPAAQRFTDKPYIEIGTTDAELAKIAGLLRRRRRHRLSVVRLAGGQGPRAAKVLDSDAVAQAVGQPRQPGVRRQQRGVADRREAWSPPAASSTTCDWSTRRSTSTGMHRRPAR